MPVPALLATLSSVPLFASRPFLTAFLTALTARFGSAIPWLRSFDVVEVLGATPDWFRSPWCLVVLGGLTVLELAAARSSEARELLAGIERLLQTAVSAAVAFAWVHSTPTPEAAGLAGGAATVGAWWPVGIAGATFAVGGLRRAALDWTGELDADAGLGLSSFRAYLEDVWVLSAFLFLVLFPLLALILALASVAALVAVRGAVRAREQRRRVPCASCARPIHAHALSCPHCRQAVASPRAVGLFGQSLERAAADRERHAFRLTFRHRCPTCAARLTARDPFQACAECGSAPFASPEAFEAYLRRVDALLPRTLLVVTALGAVPLVGLVPGLLYGRLALIAGVRGWVSALGRWKARWWVRLLHVLVLFLQPVPVIGALALPILCAGTYRAWRRAAV